MRYFNNPTCVLYPLLTATLLNIYTALADKCAAPPLNLPYRNVSVSPGLLTHGIPLQIGSPWQQIALLPSLQLDNTFIPRYTNTCVHNKDMPMTNGTNSRRSVDLLPRDGHPGSFEHNSGAGSANDEIEGEAVGAGWAGTNWFAKCDELYGGAFVPDLSRSFSDNGTNNQVAEWWFKKTDYSDWHFVKEMFTFADYLDVYTTTSDALPAKRNLTLGGFMLADEGALFGGLGASLLGLTPNASVVRGLFDEEVIASKSWSLTNSSLCFGCIDDSAHKGDFQIFKPADREKDANLPCLIQAKVEALNWHPNVDEEGATLIEESFTACVDPGVEFLVLPTDVRSAFKKIVDRDVEGEFEDYIAFKGPPKEDVGILTFKIEGGLEVNVTIPGVGKAGAEEIGEWLVPLGKGGWGAYGNTTWTLGRPFTDQVVLRWDDGKEEYGIAQLNDDPGRKEDIKPLGCDDFPKPEKSVTSTPGTGILVGGIVGGFVAGLAFAMAGLFFFNRGRNGAKTKYESLDGETVPMRSIPSDRRTMDSWMSGALSPPPPSIHESLRSQMGSRAESRAGSYNEPQLVADNSIYEAPEGGTAFPTKRERMEIFGDPIR